MDASCVNKSHPDFKKLAKYLDNPNLAEDIVINISKAKGLPANEHFIPSPEEAMKFYKAKATRTVALISNAIDKGYTLSKQQLLDLTKGILYEAGGKVRINKGVKFTHISDFTVMPEILKHNLKVANDLVDKYPSIFKLTQSTVDSNNYVLDYSEANLKKSPQFKKKANEVDFVLRSVELLNSDKAKQVFAKGEKNKWDMDKILLEIGIPKLQKQIILSLGKTNREDIITDLLANYSYTIEINTSKQHYDYGSTDPEYRSDGSIINQGEPTEYYSNLTVNEDFYKNNPDWEYKEQRITTPLITPSITGHAEFAQDNDIGWFRAWYNKKTGEVHVLEVQSDLFQKGRDRADLINGTSINSFIGIEEYEKDNFLYTIDEEGEAYRNDLSITDVNNPNKFTPITLKEFNENKPKEKQTNENQFLQLLNKDNNWVTFFVKSIIQDSAKKGYEKVLFPTGNTASKVEGHTTLEEFKKQKEDRIKELEKQKATDFYQETEGKNAGMWLGKDKPYKDKRFAEASFNNEINQLKQELERVEKEGFGALKPIYNFYENTVTNILKKQGYSAKVVTDEYGNTWNEVTIDASRDLNTIALKQISEAVDRFTLNKETVVKLADRLKRRTGVDYEVVSASEAIEMLKEISTKKYTVDNLPAGFYKNGGIVFVADRLTDDLVWHEFAHPIIDAIYKDNPRLFNNLYNELDKSPEGKEIIARVKALYDNLEEESIDFKKECVVTAIGYISADKFTSKQSKGLVAYLQELLREISGYLKFLLKNNITPNTLRSNELTLSDISDLMVSGQGKFNIGFDSEGSAQFKNTQPSTGVKPSEIYSKLGTKTESGNVVIKSWGVLKDATRAITPEGIISTRIKMSDAHFGNPFTSDTRLQNLIQVKSTKEAVERYINWVITGETNEYVFTGIQPEELENQREWILEQLQSGELKNKPIVYYKELGEPSHATALDYLINKYDWNTQASTSSNVEQESAFDYEGYDEDNLTSLEDLLAEAIPEDSNKPTEIVQEKPVPKPVKEEVKPVVTLEEVRAVDSIRYTPKGKTEQIYTVTADGKIYNKANQEVFKSTSVDRNKIISNLAIKKGYARTITYNDVKYVVYDNGTIVSTITGKILEWDENHGIKKILLAEASSLREAIKQQEKAAVVETPRIKGVYPDYISSQPFTNKELEDLTGQMAYALLRPGLDRLNLNKLKDINHVKTVVSNIIKSRYDAGVKTNNIELQDKAKHALANIDVIIEETRRYLEEFGKFANVDLLENSDGNNEVYDKAAQEISPLKRASLDIKWLVASTLERKKNSLGVITLNTDTYLGMPKLVPFGLTWKYLKNTLSNIVPTNEESDIYKLMVDKMQQNSKFRPELSDLLTRLDAQSDNIKTKFAVTFSNSEYIYSTLMFNKNKSVLTVDITDTDVSGLPFTILKEWNANAVLKLTTISAYGYKIYNDAAYDSLISAKMQLDGIILKNIKEGKTQLSQSLANLTRSTLSKFGIELSEKGLHHVLEEIPDAKNNIQALRILLQSNHYSLGEYFTDTLRKVKNGDSLLQTKTRYQSEILNQKSGLEKLAAIEAMYRPDLSEDSVIGAEGNRSQKYSLNTMGTKELAMLKNDPAKLEALMATAYSRHSKIYKAIQQGSNIRLVVLNNYKQSNKGDAGTKPKDLTLLDRLVDSINRTLSGQLLGLAEADKSTQWAIEGLGITKVSTTGSYNNKDLNIAGGINSIAVETLMTYLEDEITRIAHVHNQLFGDNKIALNDQIEHYHYEKVKGDNKANGLKLYLFPNLDLKEFGLMDGTGKPVTLSPTNFNNNVELRQYVLNSLNSLIAEDIKLLLNKKILKKEGGKLTSQYINSRVLGTKEDQYADVESAIATYTLNSIIGAVEHTKVLGGDPAMYATKGGNIFGDILKRTGSSVSGKDFRVFKDKSNNWVVRPTYSSAVVKGIVKPSDTYVKDGKIDKDLINFLYKHRDKESKVTKEDLEEMLSSYLEVNTTDAQAWITIETYKERLNGLGEWTPEHEASYNRIIKDEATLKDNILFSQPLKTVHFEKVIKDGNVVVHYNKQSEAVLNPLVTKYLKLDNLRVAMERDKVDHVIVTDGKKTGASGVTDIADDSGNILNTDAITFNPVNLSYNFLFLQQELAYKGIKLTLLGSQAVKNVMLNVRLDGEYKLPISSYKAQEEVESDIAIKLKQALGVTEESKTTISGEGLLKLYHNVNSEISNRYSSELLEELTKADGTLDLDKFNDKLAKELEGDIAKNLIDALKRGVPPDALLGIRVKSQNKLMAMFRNAAVKLKQPGAGMIQMSNFGISKAAESVDSETFNSILWLKNIDELKGPRVEEGAVKPAQIVMPYSLLEKYIPNFHSLSKKELKDILSNTDALKGFMYRIPNQALSSNDAFEIVGILPPSAGDTIIAYSDITTKTGADFDIDKAFICLPHMYYNEKLNTLNTIGYDLNNFDNNTTEALENLKLDIMISLISDPKALLDRIKPLDNDYLKDTAKKLAPEESSSRDLHFYSGLHQATVKYIMDSAKQLVGLVANHMTDHAVTQLDKLYIDYIGIGNKSSTGETVISKINDVEGKSISESMSTYANAIVDAAKTPTLLNRLNVNMFTAGAIFLLVRAGVSRKFTTEFMMQPVLKTFVEYTNSSEGKIIEYDRDENNKIIKPEDRLVRQLINKDENVGRLKSKLSSSSGSNLIHEWITELQSGDTLVNQLKNPDPITQYKILEVFKYFQTKGSELNAIVNISKTDTEGGGKTLLDAFVQEQKIIDLVNNPSFRGFMSKLGVDTDDNYNIINTKSRMVSTYRENSVRKPLELFSGVFMNMSDAHHSVLLEFIQSVNPKLIDNADMLNKLSAELFTYALSSKKSKLYGDITKLLYSPTNLAIRTASLQAIDSPVKENKLIEHLKVDIGDLTSATPSPSFVFINRDKELDINSEKKLYEGWLDLYNNAGYRKYAVDLLKYSYLTSGFAPGLGTFFHLVPAEILEQEGIIDEIKEISKESQENPIIYMSAIDQIARNLSGNTHLFKTVPEEDKTTFKDDVGNTTMFIITDNKDIVAKVGNSSDGMTTLYASYLRDKFDRLYKLINVTAAGPVYIHVEPLGTKIGIQTIKEYDRDDKFLVSLFNAAHQDRSIINKYNSSYMGVSQQDVNSDFYNVTSQFADSIDNKVVDEDELNNAEENC